MTITLDPLGDGSASERNFLTLMQLVPDMGTDPTTGLPRSAGIRFGVQALTWPGANVFTNVSTVTHGLGRTPKVIVATANLATTTLFVFTYAPGATTFNLQGWTPSAAPALNTTENVSWVAIG